MGDFANSEQLRETIAEGYDNEYDELAQPPLLNDQEGVALSSGGGFETTDFASFAKSHKKYLWSQRMKNAMRWIACAYMLLSTTRAIFIMWLLYSVIGRIVTWLPFSFEVFIGFLFSGFTAGAFGPKARSSMVWSILSAIYLVPLNFTFNITIMFLLRKEMAMFFEPTPTARLVTDLAPVYGSLLAYIILTVISLVLQLVLAGLTIANIKVSYAQSWFEAAPRRKIWKTIGMSIRVGYLIVVLVWFAVFLASIVAAIHISADGGYCPPSTEGCYSGCDPIDPTECIYPYPSTYYLKHDAATSTGYRVAFEEGSLPQTRDGSHLNPKYWNEMDGFSTISPLLFYLSGASSQHLVGHSNIGVSVSNITTTIIINAKTGALVAHWAELDAVDSNNPSIIIQPATPLDYGTRYIVGVRRITAEDGTIIPALKAFSHLLTTSYIANDFVDKARWDYYQQSVLPLLIANGFDQVELQLGWDFITASRQSSLGRVEFMRDDALRRQQRGEVSYEVQDIENFDCSASNAAIGRRVWVSVTVPSYMETNNRGSLLTRKNGNRDDVYHNGKISLGYVIQVPCTLIERPRPAKLVMEYGHGLFGNRRESLNSIYGEMAQKNAWVIVASDWYGMSKYDLLAVGKIILANPGEFARLPETLVQGFVGKAAALRTIVSSVASDPSLVFNGIRILERHDDTTVGYYGNSQGGVVGGGYLSFSPDFLRGVLGVPGSPFALLLSRSHDFDLYKAGLRMTFYRWRHIRIMLAFMQQLWDIGESAGWLHNMNQNPNETPAKQVLLQVALGDAQVPPLGAHIMARAYNASTIFPQTRPIYGIAERPALFRGSAIVEWQYEDIPDAPVINVPPEAKYDTHECVRREPEAIDQIVSFLETGVVVQTCNGKCIKQACKFLPHV